MRIFKSNLSWEGEFWTKTTKGKKKKKDAKKVKQVVNNLKKGNYQYDLRKRHIPLVYQMRRRDRALQIWGDCWDRIKEVLSLYFTLPIESKCRKDTIVSF